MLPTRSMRPVHFDCYVVLLFLLLSSSCFSDAFRVHRTVPSSVSLSTSTSLRGGSSSVPTGDSHYYFDDDPPDHETVQERVDAWRRQQRESSSRLTPEQLVSQRDTGGRMKLITTVSKGTRAFLFFVFMWRDIHLYEVADQSFKGFFRLVTVVPMLMLFLANLAGAVMSVTSSSSHATKKRLKAVLNLDKLVEGFMILYSFGRLTLFPSKYTPREIYIANVLHSVFFILHSQFFTRLTWDDISSSHASPSSATTRTPMPNAASVNSSAPYSSSSGLNPYSSYHETTEYASRDSGYYYQDEENDQQRWNN